MRTYLVTGGAGFIGSNYIHYMFRKYGDEIRIINVDLLTYAGNPENLKEVEDRDNWGIAVIGENTVIAEGAVVKAKEMIDSEEVAGNEK